MREPSIHISKSIFIKILKKEGVKISQSKIDSIFTTARNYSLDHRSILKNNKKNQKRQQPKESNKTKRKPVRFPGT